MADQIYVKEVGELYSYASSIKKNVEAITNYGHSIANKCYDKERDLLVLVGKIEDALDRAESDMEDACSRYQEYRQYAYDDDDDDCVEHMYYLEMEMHECERKYNEIKQDYDQAQSLYNVSMQATEYLISQSQIMNQRITEYAEKASNNVIEAASLIENYKNIK